MKKHLKELTINKSGKITGWGKNIKVKISAIPIGQPMVYEQHDFWSGFEDLEIPSRANAYVRGGRCNQKNVSGSVIFPCHEYTIPIQFYRIVKKKR